jgi:hypothetical protein
VRYFLGLDLGQMSDHSAMVVAEEVPRAEPPVSMGGIRLSGDPEYAYFFYDCVYLREFKLKTHYHDVVNAAIRMLELPRLKDQTALVIDGTGVGRGVADMFIQQRVIPRVVTITNGSHATAVEEGYHVPKIDLLDMLSMLFRQERVAFADSDPDPEDGASRRPKQIILEQLNKFRIKRKAGSMSLSFEAELEKDHDDMIIAAALAIWYATKLRPNYMRAEFRRDREGRVSYDYDPLKDL